ncbi:MAG: hypothetical protein AABZ34_19045 [Nitrospirota bacterium]
MNQQRALLHRLEAAKEKAQLLADTFLNEATPIPTVRALPPTRSEIGRRLQTGEVQTIEDLGGGINDSQVITLKNGERAVWKRSAGEQSARNGIRPGEYFIREALTSDIADVVGMRDLVPETVVRYVGDQIGSAQRFMDGFDSGVKAGHAGSKTNDVRRSFVMNWILGNTDRHSGNWMVKTRGANAGKLGLIDNGLNLSTSTVDTPRIWYFRQLDNLDAEIPDDVKKPWADKWTDVKQLMTNYGIDPKAIASAEARFNRIMKPGTRWSDFTQDITER